ncbi:hypothetical protein HDV04_002941 [Boothiomyces sp. JEL0838]|nr:hypothetical protein HDV04_002941 [Boothiomyces sp. JEL0838]
MRQFQSRRPDKPKFKSAAVEEYLLEIKPKLDPSIYTVFYNCLPNTLDTTVEHQGQTTFIITGAYGNAFRYHEDGPSNEWGKTDKVLPTPTKRVFEAKWELDSLCSYLQLMNSYFGLFPQDEIFTDGRLLGTVETVLNIFKEQQHMGSYQFTRCTTRSSETLLLDGKGTPSKYTGMIRSAFRPSDDSTVFPFHIPSNAMATIELGRVIPYLQNFGNSRLVQKAEMLASQIDGGIRNFGIVNHKEFGQVFAYEVDGFGSALLMDDANMPSLLSLPLLGYIDKSDILYQQTRALLLSENNPYYFSGVYKGIGSPHQGLNYIWPMSLIVQFLTSTSQQEKEYLMKVLLDSSDGLIHESFHKNNVGDFTRPWFAWANSLFAQLVMEEYLWDANREIINKI